jgi:hypothetical protein
MKKRTMARREFIKVSAGVPGVLTILGATGALPLASGDCAAGQPSPTTDSDLNSKDTFEGPHLSRVAFPLGGIGAGMICIEGSGCLSHLSLHHQADVFNEPREVFSALWIKQVETARVLEGPVPSWKKFGLKGPEYAGSASGGGGTTYGLPRFAKAAFASRFPFAEITLTDPSLPVEVVLRVFRLCRGTVSFKPAGGRARVLVSQH